MRTTRFQILAHPHFSRWLLFLAVTIGASTPAQAGDASTPNTAAALPADIEKALQMPKGDERTKALCAAATEWAKNDPPAALAWAMHLPRDMPFPVHAAVTGSCAVNNGKLAANWMIQNGKPPGYYDLHGLLYVWSWKGDSAAAAAWCAQAPKDARDIAFFSVGDGWFLKDRAAATEWASKLESDDDRHSAIRGIALKWGRSDIPAATVWIKKLKPDELQVAVKTIVGDWRANKFKKDGARDEAAIKEWLEQLPLSAAEKEEVLKVAQPPAKK